MFSFGGCWEDVPAPGYSGRGQRGDRGDPSRTCGFGGVGVVSLHRLCPNTVMLGASPSGAAVPVLDSPGHPSGLSLAACPPNSDSRRELFGEAICARLLLGGCCSQLPAWEEPSMGGNQPRTHHSVCWGLRDCRLYPGAAPSHPFRNSWASLWTFMVRHILILSPSPPFNSFLHFSSSSVKALSSCPPACPLP